MMTTEATRDFTADELDAARAQIAAQDAGVASPPVDSATLGASLLAAGGEAAEVNPAELLALIRGMQAKIDALERSKKLEAAPELIKYARAIADHIAVKATSNPAVHADPDNTFTPGLDAAASLVEAATMATEDADPGPVAGPLGKVVTWVTRHARRLPHLDYAYVLELAEELAEAAAKLGS
jgi:hypothetical protein